ncbi:MAG: hypothetical protein QOF58_1087, partial [Pseudonocardiales bacterium]|nr:hypothetical protein [Pseudonocardiales bacterium]
GDGASEAALVAGSEGVLDADEAELAAAGFGSDRGSPLVHPLTAISTIVAAVTRLPATRLTATG